MIQIMKASAGSGKTFNLAMKYITLLFRKADRHAYRHILAVTFTNKATDEMKNRILRELYTLSSAPASSPYLKWFIPGRFSAEELADVCPEDIVRELPDSPGKEITEESLQRYARELLCRILHDYSAFSVSTIDRFFQQTLKAFSREIGQFSSYQVELDREMLVKESVDRLLDSLTEDTPELLSWLTECAMEQVENGERYDIDKRLEDMAGSIKSDAYLEGLEKNGVDEDRMYSHENLRAVRELCNKVVRDFSSRVGKAAGDAIAAISTCGLEFKDFYRSFPAVLTNYAGLDGRKVVEMPGTFISRAHDSDLWFKKADRQANLGKARGLETCFEAFCNLFGEDFKVYNTALLVRRQLYELGVASDIRKEFDAVLKDRNVLGIDDSNLILKNIIDGSDAPFVYEKTGVRYENFLLDEFQDTSGIQWENFRPLLENSNSQGFDNLIVGDVKQSIYRWRGSRWNLLHESLEKEMSPCRITVLDRNFRSLRNIVSFNNSFFRFAASMMDDLYGDGSRTVSGLYSDVEQRVASRSEEEGMVEVSFCEPDCQEKLVVRTVEDLVAGGAGYGDIAVLVRNNSSGAVVAETLISAGIPVITDDSLKVKSSPAVRRMVSLMAHIDNPEDESGSYLAGPLKDADAGGYRSLADLCEALARLLRQDDEEGFDSEATYIQSFVDCVLDYSSRNGNSLHDFLEYWNDTDTDPDISSPGVSDAVRIITVHKSKGLDFNYVIFPFSETVKLYRDSDVWCCPDFGGTALEPAGKSLFDVRLSEKSAFTLFEGDFRKEKMLQYIDNINIFYVAFTRAVKGMHVIAEKPPRSLSDSMDAQVPGISAMSHILYVYLCREGVRAGFREGRYVSDTVPVSYRLGEMPAPSPAKGAEVPVTVKSAYPSFPLNPVTEGMDERDRLVFSTGNPDYFSEEGKSGLYSSGRLRGVVLHKILSGVYTADDLGDAVAEAAASGLIDASEAGDALAFLSSKIADVSSRGWFRPGARVLNETSLIDTDGSIYRPDRVILEDGGSVVIIDYKFGAKERQHERQIRKYAEMWSRKGHADVSSYLWYVMDGEIVRTT